MAVCCPGAENLLRNNHFENSRGGWFSILKSGVKLERVSGDTHNGEFAMRFESQAKNSRILTICNRDDLFGRQVRFSFWAKGKGNFKPILYCYYRDAGNKIKIIIKSSEKHEVLNDEYRQYSTPFDLSGLAAFQIAPGMEFDGEFILFDDVVLEFITDPSKMIKAEQNYVALNQAGEFGPLKFKTSGDEPVTAFAGMSGGFMTLESLSISNGYAVFPKKNIEIPKNNLLQVTAVNGGNFARTYIENMSSEEYTDLDHFSRNIRFAGRQRILLLGDSLTDFDRGRNWGDQLEFWLNRHCAGQAEIDNRAVGGDTILRVEARLKQKKQYRQEMYNGIFDHKPDIAMVLLGHNDTRSMSKDNFAAPLISPEQQEKSTREVIAILRRANPQCRILLLSSVSSDYETTSANARKNLEQGKLAIRFGDPEKQQKFNEIFKKLAGELDCEYVDVYTPSSAYKPKHELFRPGDGVHLSPTGFRFLTGEVLKHLAGEK